MSLIVKVIQSYYPDWQPPVDRGREWYSCLCPFHGESHPSASVSFVNEAFNCFACGEKGDALAIIMRREEIGYHEALEFAEGILPGCNEVLQKQPSRKSRRRAFGEPGADDPTKDRRSTRVPAGLRSRPSAWA